MFTRVAPGKNGLIAAVVDIGGREVTEALMVAMMIVAVDEGADLQFEFAGQVIVFEQDAVFERLMPSFVRNGLTRPHRGHGPYSLPWVWGWFGAPRT